MFGISTFAQSPFAALGGGTAFPVDVSESFTLSDTYANFMQFSGIVADYKHHQIDQHASLSHLKKEAFFAAHA